MQTYITYIVASSQVFELRKCACSVAGAKRLLHESPSMEVACVFCESTDRPRHLLVMIVTCLPCARVWSKSGVQIVAVVPCPDTTTSDLPACTATFCRHACTETVWHNLPGVAQSIKIHMTKPMRHHVTHQGWRNGLEGAEGGGRAIVG